MDAIVDRILASYDSITGAGSADRCLIIEQHRLGLAAPKPGGQGTGVRGTLGG